MVGVFVASLSVFMATGVLIPVLPHFVHGTLGAGDAAVGLVIGAFSVTAIVSRPWSGRLADAHGRRIVFVVGASIMAVGALIMFIPAGATGAVMSRLLCGVGQGAIFTAGSAWAVDLAPEGQRGRTISWYGLSVWGGLSVGPVVGEALYRFSGYHAVWLATMLLPAIGGAIAWAQPADRRRPRPDGQPRPPLIAREAVLPGCVLALTTVGYSTLASFAGLLMAAQSASHGGLVFPVFATAVIGARVLLGSLPDRIGALRTAVGAAVCEMVGLATIAMGQGWVVAVIGALVMGTAFAVLFPALALLVVERTSADRRASALGTFSALFDAGFGAGAPIAGVIASMAGYAAAFWFASGCSAGAAVLALVLLLRSRPRAG